MAKETGMVCLVVGEENSERIERIYGDLEAFQKKHSQIHIYPDGTIKERK
jgi:hypothetical protein